MSTFPIKIPRKLIEVALPLDAINEAASAEKNPFATVILQHYTYVVGATTPRGEITRAVIFGQMVNDPGYQQGSGFKYGKNKKEAAA